MAEPSAVKETKAQRADRLKHEKNPWGSIEEIRSFARNGRSSIPAEWSTYFRWWGIYTQGDGVGVTGGPGGESKAPASFVMRAAIPNGSLRPDPARALAGIARRHGLNLADIT